MAADQTTQPAISAVSPSTRSVSTSEFQTAMVHLYRGEVGRSNTWRMRLDGTTNWAVLTTATALSFAFSNAHTTHVMLLVNSLLVLFFMYIEARRYRFYDMWRARVRLLEIELFAEMLNPSRLSESVSWRELLADDLLHPRFSIPLRVALARRLRRNYVWIFGVLLVSWVVKVLIHPFPVDSLKSLMERIAIGPIPAWFVLLVGVLFNGMLLFLLFFADEGVKTNDEETLSRSEARERMGTGEDPN